MKSSVLKPDYALRQYGYFLDRFLYTVETDHGLSIGCRWLHQMLVGDAPDSISIYHYCATFHVFGGTYCLGDPRSRKLRTISIHAPL